MSDNSAFWCNVLIFILMGILIALGVDNYTTRAREKLSLEALITTHDKEAKLYLESLTLTQHMIDSLEKRITYIEEWLSKVSE